MNQLHILLSRLYSIYLLLEQTDIGPGASDETCEYIRWNTTSASSSKSGLDFIVHNCPVPEEDLKIKYYLLSDIQKIMK